MLRAQSTLLEMRLSKPVGREPGDKKTCQFTGILTWIFLMIISNCVLDDSVNAGCDDSSQWITVGGRR